MGKKAIDKWTIQFGYMDNTEIAQDETNPLYILSYENKNKDKNT